MRRNHLGSELTEKYSSGVVLKHRDGDIDVDQSVPTDDRALSCLAVLASRSTPVTKRELARAVAARDRNPDEPGDTTVDRVHIDLRHRVLPSLTEADLVKTGEDGVEPAHQLSFDSGTLDTGTEAPTVSTERRRYIQTIVENREEPLDRDRLVSRVAAHEDAENSHRLRLVLHHVDLPVLDDRGLLTYDADDGVVEPPSYQ